MELNTWEDIDKKYKRDRKDMSEEQHREFVTDCFNVYEKEGFSKVFWSSDSEYEKYNNQSYTVISRATEKEIDLEVLPMWNIKFNDGFKISAYPDEIIPSQMKINGCNIELS